MVGDAFRTFQYSKHFHEAYESGYEIFYCKFVLVYFDDILIYNKTEKDHLMHLREVLIAL